MKQLILPATGLEMEVPDNFYYHDDGVVRSIADQVRSLNRRYRVRGDKLWIYRQKSAEALFFNPKAQGGAICTEGIIKFYPPKEDESLLVKAIESGETINAHSFVLKNKNRYIEIKNRGHEELHIILLLKLENLFKEGLERIPIGTDGFESLSEEDKCDLGGLYAFHKEYGFSMDTLAIRYNDYIPEVLRNYLKRNTNRRIDIK